MIIILDNFHIDVHQVFLGKKRYDPEMAVKDFITGNCYIVKNQDFPSINT